MQLLTVYTQAAALGYMTHYILQILYSDWLE